MFESRALAYGVGCGVALVTFGIVVRWLADGGPPPHAWAFYVSIPLAILVGLWRTDGSGRSWKKALRFAAVVALVGSALYAVSVFVINAWIDDSLLRWIVLSAEQRIAEQGLAGEEGAAQLARVKALARPAPFALLIFFQLVVGALVMSLPAVWFFGRNGRQAT